MTGKDQPEPLKEDDIAEVTDGAGATRHAKPAGSPDDGLAPHSDEKLVPHTDEN